MGGLCGGRRRRGAAVSRKLVKLCSGRLTRSPADEMITTVRGRPFEGADLVEPVVSFHPEQGAGVSGPEVGATKPLYKTSPSATLLWAASGSKSPSREEVL
jgi:hypothetical protein